MPIVHTQNGRFRFSVYLAGQRFVVERYATLDRTEDHPDGKVVEFVVSDNSDNSKTPGERDLSQTESDVHKMTHTRQHWAGTGCTMPQLPFCTKLS